MKKNKKNKKDFSRYKVFYIAMAVIFAIISSRLIYLQVFLVDEYREKANSNNYMNVSVPAARGDIVDKNGLVFATSIQSYTLEFTETPESKESFYPTMQKVFEILDEKNIPMVDEFPIVIKDGKLEFNFQATDEQSRRWMELRFKKDRGLNEVVARKEFGSDVKLSELTDEENDKVDELLLKLTPEDVFKKLEKDYDLTRYYELTLEEKRRLMIVRDALKMQSYSGYDQIIIANNLDQETAFIFEQMQANLPGITVDNKPMRYYPEKELGSGFLGYISSIDPWNEEIYEEQGYDASTDEVGKTGIEAAFEKYLSGTKGQERIQVNKAGRRVAVLGEVEAYAGDTVQLNIDMNIQKVAEAALDDTLAKLQKERGTENATRGAVVVLRNTGEVLALASRPGYDPNIFTMPGLLTPEISEEYFNPDLEKKGREYIKTRGLANKVGILTADELRTLSYDERVEVLLNRMFPLDENIEGNTTIREDVYDIFPKPFYNYATLTLVPPGSTFKPVTALAGLEEGVITSSTLINDVGRYTKNDYKGNCWIYNKYHGSHGFINVAKALEVSCNYFFFDVADRLYTKTGGTKESLDFIANYAWKLGLGIPRDSDLKASTGIEITENFGQVYNYESSKDMQANAYVNQLVEFLEQGINSQNDGNNYKPFDIVRQPEVGNGKELEQIKLTNSKKKILVDAIKEEMKIEKNPSLRSDKIIEKFIPMIKDIINSDKAIQNIGYTDKDIQNIALAMFHAVNDAYAYINSPANAYDASIGQGMNRFTPLQLASYLATLVNGGVRYEAKLVDKIIDSETGEVIEDITPQIITQNSFDKRNIEAIKAGMRDVTVGENGTTSGVFNGFPIPNGGKTGTSNVVDEKIQDAIGRNAAGLYVGFAPYENPEIIVCSILFDSNGDKGTIARAVFEEYFRDEILSTNPGYQFMYDVHKKEENKK